MPGSMRDAFEKAGIKVPPKAPRPASSGGRRGPPRSGRPSGPRPGGGPGSAGPGRGGQSLRVPKLPDSYFQSDESGNPCLRTEFVSRGKLDPYVAAFSRGGLTTGQLRRFFNHCREIERQLTVEGKSWEQVAAAFASTSAHAHNASAANKIPSHFRDFIDDNVRRVLSSDDPKASFLRGFLRHFEAILGFGAARLKKGA